MKTVYELGECSQYFEMGSHYHVTNKRTKQHCFMSALRLPESHMDLAKCISNIQSMQSIKQPSCIPAQNIYRDGLEKYYLVSNFFGQDNTDLASFVIARGSISEHDLGTIADQLISVLEYMNR